jgi:hypothetical protein
MVGKSCIVKRMPDSGPLHAFDCPSYEPPADVSGLSAVMGAAIRVNPVDGTTALKLDFPLSMARQNGAGRTTASVRAHDGQVVAHPARLSLRSLLHYLWSEAGFHRWTPAMADKRNWFVLRKYLLQAAQDKLVRGQSLASSLLVPETFVVERKESIRQRRAAAMQCALAPNGAKGGQRLMLLLAEVKEITAGRIGKKLVVKHMPDETFLLPADLARRMEKRYADELELWNALDACHLLVMGTFGLSANGVASMQALTLMLTTAEWLPVENRHEIDFVAHLVGSHRRFDKCLRYDLAADQPLACAVLADTPAPVALYLSPAD